MADELFADTVGEIAITGAMVRFNLMSYSVTERDDKKQPKLEFRRRVVMPVEGFVQSYALMTQVMQQLEKQGAIQRRVSAEKPAEVTVKPSGERGSPNFKPG